jgi:hypothetical protein
MSKTKIPDKVIKQLLIKSGGRCEFLGCNKSLYQDLTTKRFFNHSYIAHIVADEPDGPRGDPKRSKLLAREFSNLMLLCDIHHRLIDKIDVPSYPESILQVMKREHEERIERVSGIASNMNSYIVIYKANIGAHTPNITYDTVKEFLLPSHYPALSSAIDLSLSNSPQRDKNESFWNTEIENLQVQFNEQLRPRIRRNEINHLSIFALAPMPLLMTLGSLINDIHNVEIHQPVRNPKTWNLSEEIMPIVYKVIEPEMQLPLVALNISLSATINDDRIRKVLGSECSIYTLTIDHPFNDFIKSKNQLWEFSSIIRRLLNTIKSKYNAQTPLHIFPAMPVATAIELGRAWMPKADMPLVVYDENTINGGFFKVLEIRNND